MHHIESQHWSRLTIDSDNHAVVAEGSNCARTRFTKTIGEIVRPAAEASTAPDALAPW